MAELLGVDLSTHLEAIVSEFQTYKTIYGYPERKIFKGFVGFDFSVDFHGHRAATPLGPASGPHTQMAQNILLSFLGGSRIIELKTVQILDQLDIPRPCIDVRNVGYNVEWSQELRLDDSYREYVTAWVLLKILKDMDLLGLPKGDPFYDTVFDISVGYDLKGIASPPVRRWLQNMQDAGEAIDAMLAALPPKFAAFKKLPVPTRLADSVTLSTFHGCPRDEIEAIVQHLIREYHFHVIVKMNPTILGYDFVRHTLQDDLGYEHIALDPAAFESDLQFDEGVAMMKRLAAFAKKHNRNVGAKFTNTLVVKNREQVFEDEVQYLSGPPLHVLAMHAMHRFRRELGDDFHISFSAGITKHNFAEAVRCNMKPITTCTDLLKTGGYTRLFDYLLNLKTAMEKCDCRSIEAFIIKSAVQEKGNDRHAAGMENAERLMPQLVENPRYHFRMNKKAPPKIDSQLALFDCITCNKCLPVCPNAANFSIPTGTVDLPIAHFRIENGAFVGVEDGVFQLQKTHQIANLADFCNECGDCDTYCPEHGGPFIAKPRFFFSQERFEKDKNQNGFFFETPTRLLGCIEGMDYSLALDSQTGNYVWKSDEVEMELSVQHELISGRLLNSAPDGKKIDMASYYTMRVLLDGMLNHPEMYASVLLRKKHR